MQVKLYGCYPYLLIYTDKLPDNVGGRTTMFTVRIKPKYKDDMGILKHEEIHIGQYWTITLALLLLSGIGGCFRPLVWLTAIFCPMVEPILCQLSAPYRQWKEVKAYREQLKWPPATDSTEYYSVLYSVFLSQNYNLKITIKEARELLKEV